MSTLIYKYAVDETHSLPEGYKILSVGIDPKGVLVFWAEVETPAGNFSEHEDVTLISIGTGWAVPDASTYIGTVVHGELVWHVYKV